MKKLFALLLTVITLVLLTACGSATKKTPEETFIEIKESPDKYTWYIKNYVGKNCASFGETGGGGFRYDEYGEGDVKFIYIADDNSFVDPANKDSLKNYVVTAQNIAPNTELKLVFDKSSTGEEYSWVEEQNIEEIELYVKRVTDTSSTTD